MLRPLTVANVPVIAVPVTMVKIFPIAGLKLLIRLTVRVPPKLAPFDTASRLYFVPTVLPPIEILSRPAGFCV